MKWTTNSNCVAIDNGCCCPGPTGPTGAAGSTGPTGPSSNLPSTYYGSEILSTAITGNPGLTGSTGGTKIGLTTNITITQTSYLWATADLTFYANLTSTDIHTISAYMTLNGTTSSVSRNTIIGRGPLRRTYASISLNQRTNTTVPFGTYSIEIFAYSDSTSNNIFNQHVDVFALGHLS